MSFAKQPRPTTVVADGIHFGEGPRWHHGRLWFSDFFRFSVLSYGDGGVRTECTIDDRPSGLGWLPDGRLLMVAMTSRQVRRREHDGTVVVHADLSDLAAFHCNDMAVDAAGRAYVGNFGFDLDAWVGERGEDAASRAAMPASIIVRIDPDGTRTVAAGDLHFPNGTVISPDGTTMVVAESMARRLTAFTVAADGTLSDRRVWADTDRPVPGSDLADGVVPDGICLDAEGAIWVADAGSARCVRYAPGGEVLDVVDTGDRCFACMLGGDDRRTLYVLASKENEASRAAARATGTLRTARVAVAGAGLP